MIRGVDFVSKALTSCRVDCGWKHGGRNVGDRGRL